MTTPKKPPRWIAPEQTGDKVIEMHGRRFALPSHAIMRHAGRVTFVYCDGRVRALGEGGEINLTPEEVDSIKAHYFAQH